MTVLHVGDLHVGARSLEDERDICRRVLEKARKADLVILCGDMTEAGMQEQYERLRTLYGGLKDRLCLVRGNHDRGWFMKELATYLPEYCSPEFVPAGYPVWVWKTDWFEMLDSTAASLGMPQELPEPHNRLAQPPVVIMQDGLGPYYAFEREGYKFIVLDSSTHRLGKEQQIWFAREVQSSLLPVIVLIHHSILPMGSIWDSVVLWDKEPVLELLLTDERVLGVFSGHVHYSRAWNVNGRKVVTTADRGAARLIELRDRAIGHTLQHPAHSRSGKSPESRVCQTT